ncbi:hypothetical protein BURKHO8Y_140434 [Burkholderia sp. 8Y]|nr:hypothetical protein BURKHO8Y_140434 [Burkholderia sp. 8Y]
MSVAWSTNKDKFIGNGRGKLLLIEVQASQFRAIFEAILSVSQFARQSATFAMPKG